MLLEHFGFLPVLTVLTVFGAPAHLSEVHPEGGSEYLKCPFFDFLML